MIRRNEIRRCKSAVNSYHQVQRAYQPSQKIWKKEIISLNQKLDVDLGDNSEELAKYVMENYQGWSNEQVDKKKLKEGQRIILNKVDTQALASKQLFRSIPKPIQTYNIVYNELLKSYNQYETPPNKKIKRQIIEQFKKLERQRQQNKRKNKYQKQSLIYLQKMFQTIQRKQQQQKLIRNQLLESILVLDRTIFYDSIMFIEPSHQQKQTKKKSRTKIYDNISYSLHQTIYLQQLLKPQRQLLNKVQKKWFNANKTGFYHKRTLDQNDRENTGSDNSCPIKTTRKLTQHKKSDKKSSEEVIVHMERSYPSFRIKKQEIKQILGQYAFSQKYRTQKQTENQQWNMCHVCLSLIPGPTKSICTNQKMYTYTISNLLIDTFHYSSVYFENAESTPNFVYCYYHFYDTARRKQVCNRFYCSDCKFSIKDPEEINEQDSVVCRFCEQKCVCTRCSAAARMVKMISSYLQYGGELDQLKKLFIFPENYSQKIKAAKDNQLLKKQFQPKYRNKQRKRLQKCRTYIH